MDLNQEHRRRLIGSGTLASAAWLRSKFDPANEPAHHILPPIEQAPRTRSQTLTEQRARGHLEPVATPRTRSTRSHTAQACSTHHSDRNRGAHCVCAKGFHEKSLGDLLHGALGEESASSLVSRTLSTLAATHFSLPAFLIVHHP